MMSKPTSMLTTLQCRHAHEQLTHAVQQAVQQNSGTECLLLVVDALQEEALKLQQDAQDHADAESIASQEQLDLNSRPIQLGRRSIWYLCTPHCACSTSCNGLCTGINNWNMTDMRHADLAPSYYVHCNALMQDAGIV